MRYVIGGFAIIALVLIGIFSIQNLEAVNVSFLFWSASISKVLVIIGAYLLGMLTGWALVEISKKLLQN